MPVVMFVVGVFLGVLFTIGLLVMIVCLED